MPSRPCTFCVVGLAALGLCVLYLVFGERRLTIGQVIEKYGYTELRPPTTLHPPGTLVHVSSHSPLTLETVCSVTAAFGPRLPVSLSNSANTDIAQELRRVVKVNVDSLSQVYGSARYQDVSNVTVTFGRVRVLEVADADVFANLRHRTPFCAHAVARSWQTNDTVTLVRSVLQADVTYTISFKSDGDASVKAEIARGVAGDLGLTVNETTIGTGTIEGDALYWGVIDDVNLGREEIVAHRDSVRIRLLPPNTVWQARVRLVP